MVASSSHSLSSENLENVQDQKIINYSTLQQLYYNYYYYYW